MAGFDTNRVRLALIEEQTPGTTPNNPGLVRQRVTNMPSLAVTPETVESEELDPTAQTTDLIKVGQTAGGEFGMEFSYDAQHQAMIGVMRNDWKQHLIYGPGDVTTVGTNELTVNNKGAELPEGALVLLKGYVTAANNGIKKVGAATNTKIPVAAGVNSGITASATLSGKETARVVGCMAGAGKLKAITDGITVESDDPIIFTDFRLEPGQLIKIGGSNAANRFATAANNALVRVVKVEARKLTLTDLPAGWTADTGTGKQIQVWLPESYIKNDVKTKSFTMLQSFLDHSPVTHQLFKGMRIGTMNMELRSKQIVTFTVNAQGTGGEITDVSNAGLTNSSILPATTDVIINSSSNVAELREGGSKIASPNYVTGMTVGINNNPRNDDAVGYETAINIGGGTFQLTGTLNTYFGSKAMVEKVIKNTKTSLMLNFKDNDGQRIVWDMPLVKYSAGSPSVSGKNAADTADLGYTALKHPEYGFTLSVAKFRYME